MWTFLICPETSYTLIHRPVPFVSFHRVQDFFVPSPGLFCLFETFLSVNIHCSRKIMFWTSIAYWQIRTAFRGSFSKIMFWTKRLCLSKHPVNGKINFWTRLLLFSRELPHLCPFSSDVYFWKSRTLFVSPRLYLPWTFTVQWQKCSELWLVE